MYHSEHSPINPRTGVKWAHGDALRCLCGAVVRVGLGGFGNLRLHQRGVKHGKALQLRIQTAVAARNREAAREAAGVSAHAPTAAPQGTLIPYKRFLPGPNAVAIPPRTATPQTPATQLIRSLRRTIYSLPSEVAIAASDGPLAFLNQDLGAGDVQPDSLWDVDDVHKAIQQLFGPNVSQETIETYVERGAHGLDGMARWLRVHVYKRVPEAQQRPLQRMLDAIRAVASRRGFSLPAVDVEDSTPSPAPVMPVAGPSRLPFPPRPLQLPRPAGPPPDAVCPLCGPDCGRLKSATEQVTHMSAHILFDRRVPPDACGFCLQPPMAGCRFFLRRDRQQLNYAASYCRLMPAHLSYGPASRSIPSSPCSNMPKVCPLCPADAPAVWKYHMQRHLVTKHPTAALDQLGYLWYISPDEIRGMRGVLEKAFIRVRRHITEISEQATVLDPSRAHIIPGPPAPQDVRTPTPPGRPPIPVLSSSKVQPGHLVVVHPHVMQTGPSRRPGMQDSPTPVVRPHAVPPRIGPKTFPTLAKQVQVTPPAPPQTTGPSQPPVAHRESIPAVPRLPAPEIDLAYARQKRLREDGAIDLTVDDDMQSKRPRITM